MSFGARDLALLLPDNIGETQSFKTSEQLRAEGEKGYEAPKPKVDASKKTRRYFPGKTPDWIPNEEDNITFTVDGRAGGSGDSRGDENSSVPVDRRLARLQKKTAADASSTEGRRRQRYEAEVVKDNDSDEDEGGAELKKSSSRWSRYEVLQEGSVLEGDALQQLEEREDEEREDEITRRARIKAKLMAAAAEEEERAAAAGRGKVAEEEGEESEYETATDSDESSSEEETGAENITTCLATSCSRHHHAVCVSVCMNLWCVCATRHVMLLIVCGSMILCVGTDRVMLKPVFIPRSRRETIREKEERDEQAAMVQEQSALLKEVRVVVSFHAACLCVCVLGAVWCAHLT